MSAVHYLGVDGGGTKTAFVLIDESARVLGEVVGPSCYYLSSGIDLVGRVLEDGIAAIERETGVGRDRFDQAFFGLPAYGEASADLPELDAIPGRVLGHGRYSCGNDMVAGWAGSLGGEDGVNVVAGTGSIAYGEWAGASRRAGGWSEMFGDEGSGYWTAIQGLNAFSRMTDGRLPEGPLHAAIRDALGVDADLDVISVVVDRWAGRRDRIAALSRVVSAAADQGDRAAQGILDRAGVELAALAAAVRTGIGLSEHDVVPVSYSGGMFTVPRVRESFTRALGPGWDLRTPRYGPAVGAALVARKRAA